MLIAVVGAAVAIIGVALLSQPAPEKIPALEAVISNTGNTIQIFHNGGDTLQKDQMKIMVDGVDRTNSFVLRDGNGWSKWMIGDTLIYTADPAPTGAIQIIYTGGSSGRVLLSWEGTTSAGIGTTTTTTPVTTTPVTTPTLPVLTADFYGNPTSDYLPLPVLFTDLSTGPIDQWSWAFGDGSTSSVPSPQYTYPDAGIYTVILTVTNTTYSITSTATKVDYIHVLSFAEYVSNENVFVYGTKLFFFGDTITGEDATVVITGSLLSTEMNMNAAIAIKTIYVDGDVYLGPGSASLGYPGKIGNTSVNGDFNIASGSHMIYGNVNISGNANLAGATIRDTVTVDGDVNLGWGTVFGDDALVFYTGELTKPAYYSRPSIESKCIHVDSVPGVTMPDLPIPSAKDASWYAEEGYTYDLLLSSNTKIYSPFGYTSALIGTVSNVIIVAADGDITLMGGGSHVSGVLFAPKGRVTIAGDSFEGVIIARDGLYVPSGGTDITFKDLEDYIADTEDYPF